MAKTDYLKLAQEFGGVLDPATQAKQEVFNQAYQANAQGNIETGPKFYDPPSGEVATQVEEEPQSWYDSWIDADKPDVDYAEAAKEFGGVLDPSYPIDLPEQDMPSVDVPDKPAGYGPVAMWDRAKKFGGDVHELLTGAKRINPETEALPDWQHIPEFNQLMIEGGFWDNVGNFIDQMSTAAATSVSSPEDIVDLFKQQYGLESRQDDKGSHIIKSKMDGKEYAIKPGLRLNDIVRGITTAVMSWRAGQAPTLMGQAAEGMAVAGGLETTKALKGASFDPYAVAAEGAMPFAGAALKRVFPSFPSPLRRKADDLDVPTTKAPTSDDPFAIPKDLPQAETIGGESFQQAEFTPPQEAPGLQETAEVFQQASTGGARPTVELAEKAFLDPQLLEDAKLLGFEEYMDPDHLTTSQSFRELSQAIKSEIGAELRQQEIDNLVQIGNKANSLIEEMGGSVDMSDVDFRVKEKLDTIRGQIYKKENKLFNEIKDEIPQDYRGEAKNTLEYLEKRISEVDGYERLSSFEKDVYKAVMPTEEGVQPKYSLLNSLRQDAGIKSETTKAFGDVNSRRAKGLYATLAKDQSELAGELGLDKKRTIANLYTKARKGIEDDLTSLYGKQIDKSIIQPLTTGIGKLQKGDITTLENTLKRIPKSQRKFVTTSALATAFGKATKNGDLNFNTFSKWYNGLKKNSRAYEMLKNNLEPKAMKKVDALARVSEGISKTTREYITTGKLATAKNYLDMQEGLFKRAFKFGTTRPASKIGLNFDNFFTSNTQHYESLFNAMKSREFDDYARAVAEGKKLTTFRERLLGARTFKDFLKKNRIKAPGQMLMNLERTSRQTTDLDKEIETGEETFYKPNPPYKIPEKR